VRDSQCFVVFCLNTMNPAMVEALALALVKHGDNALLLGADVEQVVDPETGCYRLLVDGLLNPFMAKAGINRVSRELTDAREDGVIPCALVVDDNPGEGVKDPPRQAAPAGNDGDS